MLWSRDEKYSGWAADAHPDMTQADLRSIARRMLDHEANLLWVGHNNTGEVEIGKWEPALSYAVSGKVELTLDDRLECSYGRFWQECFGLEKASRAYVVTNVGRELVYNISGRESAIALPGAEL